MGSKERPRTGGIEGKPTRAGLISPTLEELQRFYPIDEQETALSKESSKPAVEQEVEKELLLQQRTEFQKIDESIDAMSEYLNKLSEKLGDSSKEKILYKKVFPFKGANSQYGKLSGPIFKKLDQDEVVSEEDINSLRTTYENLKKIFQKTVSSLREEFGTQVDFVEGFPAENIEQKKTGTALVALQKETFHDVIDTKISKSIEENENDLEAYEEFTQRAKHYIRAVDVWLRKAEPNLDIKKAREYKAALGDFLTMLRELKQSSNSLIKKNETPIRKYLEDMRSDIVGGVKFKTVDINGAENVEMVDNDDMSESNQRWNNEAYEGAYPDRKVEGSIDINEELLKFTPLQDVEPKVAPEAEPVGPLAEQIKKEAQEDEKDTNQSGVPEAEPVGPLAEEVSKEGFATDAEIQEVMVETDDLIERSNLLLQENDPNLNKTKAEALSSGLQKFKERLSNFTGEGAEKLTKKSQEKFSGYLVTIREMIEEGVQKKTQDHVDEYFAQIEEDKARKQENPEVARIKEKIKLLESELTPLQLRAKALKQMIEGNAAPSTAELNEARTAAEYLTNKHADLNALYSKLTGLYEAGSPPETIDTEQTKYPATEKELRQASQKVSDLAKRHEVLQRFIDKNATDPVTESQKEELLYVGKRLEEERSRLADLRSGRADALGPSYTELTKDFERQFKDEELATDTENTKRGLRGLLEKWRTKNNTEGIKKGRIKSTFSALRGVFQKPRISKSFRPRKWSILLALGGAVFANDVDDGKIMNHPLQSFLNQNQVISSENAQQEPSPYGDVVIKDRGDSVVTRNAEANKLPTPEEFEPRTEVATEQGESEVEQTQSEETFEPYEYTVPQDGYVTQGVLEAWQKNPSSIKIPQMNQDEFEEALKETVQYIEADPVREAQMVKDMGQRSDAIKLVYPGEQLNLRPFFQMMEKIINK